MASKYGVTAQNVRDAAFGVTIPPGATVDAQLDRLIEKAELQLPNKCIATGITKGTLDQDTVKSVIEDMVIRVTKNAKGYRQRSIDDYSVTIDTAISSGALYLSPSERELLCPPRRTGTVGSIRIGVPSWRVPHGG